jgi:hypothetical protein
VRAQAGKAFVDHTRHPLTVVVRSFERRRGSLGHSSDRMGVKALPLPAPLGFRFGALRRNHLRLTFSRYTQAGGQKIMLRALGRLLLRGAVSMGICAVTALCLTGFLSLVAASFQPKKQAVAEMIASGNCKPGRCRPKTSGRRQVVAAKAQ